MPRKIKPPHIPLKTFVSRRRSRPEIFVSNDDGHYGPGLKPLLRALSALGNVTAVVPDMNRSAASHAITLHKPLRFQRVDRTICLLNGTPADCVRFGVLSLLKNRVDLVVAGINRGPNLGADTLYSGTVAAAMEGCLLGIPSAAFSLADTGRGHYAAAARFAKTLARDLLRRPIAPETCLNVNVPDRPYSAIRGVAVTNLGQRIYGRDLEAGVDPRGQTYYWLAGETPGGVAAPGSDISAVESGKISVTPLQPDLTARPLLPGLRRRKWRV